MATQWITAAGLQIPTLDELLDQLNEGRKDDVDANIAIDSLSLSGQCAAIEAKHLREAWEALQTAFDAINPDNADDAILDGVCAITGTLRDPATYSKLEGTRRATVNLDDGATVTAGVFVAHVDGDPTNRWVATETITNDTGVTDDFSVAFRSEKVGVYAANAGTLTVIATATSGVNSITNAFDAIAGHLVEDDGSLRLRREGELRAAGSTTAAALKSNLLQYTDETGAHPILNVEVLENTSDATDANGIPPHSWEVIVWDGPSAAVPDEDIAEIIAENRPLGGHEVGSTTVADPEAIFTRPAQLPITLTVTLRYRDGEYVGDDAIKTLLVATAAAEQRPEAGGDEGVVAFSDYLASAWSGGGVTRVTSIALSCGGSSGTNVDISIALRSVATLVSGGITISSSAE